MRGLLQIAIGAVLVFVTAFESHRIFLSFVPPLEIKSAVIVNQRLRSNEDLLIDYSVVRSRICKATVDRFIKRERDNVVVFRTSFPGNAVMLGEVKQRAVVPLPEGLEPGEYSVSTANFFECYEGVHSVIHAPLFFTVVR